MNRSTFIALSFAGALSLAATPAFAQHHRGGGDGGGARGDNGGAAPEQHRDAAPQPQRQAQPQPQAQPRQRQEQARPREEQRAPQQARPQEQRAVPRDDYRRGQQQAAPRYEAPRYAAPRYAAPRYSAPRYSGRYYGPRYVGPRFSVAPRRFYRPYYVFRPRFSIGFGIWAGFPVTYYDPYYYPYDYYPYASSAPGAYPVPPQGSVNVQPLGQPDEANMGGVSFDITPNTAEIYVDGNYFGQVGQFTASSQPLGLPAGRHHIEIREAGYQVTSFDVDIIAGQVIPFQGQLQP